MTNQEFQAVLEACNWRSPEAVSKLVTSSYTNVKFNDKVDERIIADELGAYNYFGGLFGKDVWPDGQGMDEIREYYVDPHIPFSFSYFVRQMEICDPNLADECRRDRCQVPEGGRGTLPPFRFFKWGFETPRDCIANIRSIHNFRYWAMKIIRGRELIDQQVMNMFYTMAGIYTAGHKIVMQGVRDANGNLILAPNSNPRNPLRGGLYNFMEEKFPQPTNLNDLLPLTLDTLEPAARYWSYTNSSYRTATGPRGEAIYEIWTPDDWFRQEQLKNPDRVKQTSMLMPNKLFPGWVLQPDGQREVVENWAAKVMPWLPRFAPTADGRIIPVDNKVGVDIEVGKEYLFSNEFDNAPIGIAVVVSGKQGTILSRPALTTSGAGFPIQPITGDSPWRIRNDYDKECNPDLNMPYSQKDYEMGFRMDDPNAATAFLYRRSVFNMRPVNDCDLAPIFTVSDPDVACPITTIGCQVTKIRENNSIVDPGVYKPVECTAAACGNTGSSPYYYNIKIQRKANQPEFNSLQCECGSNVKLFVHDDEGEFLREQIGTVHSTFQGFPYARYMISTTTALAEGECIRGIACDDDTPLQGNVIDAYDLEDGDVTVILSSYIACDNVGDDVQVRYYDASGAVLGTIAAEIVSFEPTTATYVLTSTNPSFKADAYENQASIGVSCNQAPNQSSSGD